jgi:two-component system, LytTR family, response regulator
MKYTAVVVEDEFKVREVFINLVHHYCKEIEIVGQAENISDAFNIINATNPDIVFLDIEMPHGNGFELLKKFQNPSFEVIFVTSYGHYALTAIKYSALDYLLKPILVSDLLEMLNRIKQKFNKKTSPGQFNVLLENLDSSFSEKKLVIHTKTKTECVFLKDIIYLKADVNYTNIQMTESKMYVAKTLGEYEDLLCNSDSPFMRVHKTYIVNIDFIQSINKINNSILLKDSSVLEVSRRKKQDLIEKLNFQ